MAYGKSIELFLANGTADSLIIAELSNWNGKAIKIPRIEVSACNRDDLREPGVYFLFCKNEEEENDAVYIGEAENIYDRLVQHIRDYTAEKEKYYWNTAVVFTGRDLNKAHIRYLENKLVEIARNAKRYDILTKNTYKNTKLKESQIAAMDEFIDNVQVLISALGYKVLEPKVSKDSKTFGEDDCLYLTTGGTEAKGVITTEGFVLLAGAKINEKTSVKSLSKGAVKLRNKLMESELVDNFITTDDIVFSSSSAAGDFVTGYSISGPQNWKNANGISLKEIEAQKTQE